MGEDDTSQGGVELEPGALLPDEVVVRHWAAPGGRGVLTNLRLLMLGHPRPVHRPLEWDLPLEKIEALEVEPLRSRWHPQEGIAEPVDDGPVLTHGFDPTYGVEVNGRTVFVGNPEPCADLQQRLDDARASRCLRAYGRVLPYHPGEYALEDRSDAEEIAPESGLFATESLPNPAGEFLLFVAGIGDPLPDSRSRVPPADPTATPHHPVQSSANASQEGSPSSSPPARLYAPRAAIDWMVLDVAGRCKAALRVVDVNHAGSFEELVRQYVSRVDDLPILVGPSGARLVGAASFVPETLTKFFEKG